MLVFAEFAVAAAVLRSQAKTAGRLLVVFAFVLATAIPICVAEIDPQAARGMQHFARVAEYIDEFGDEILGLLLKSELARDAVIALAVERGRRDDAVREDSGLAQPPKHLPNLTTENQAILVGVNRFLPQRVGLENFLR